MSEIAVGTRVRVKKDVSDCSPGTLRWDAYMDKLIGYETVVTANDDWDDRGVIYDLALPCREWEGAGFYAEWLEVVSEQPK